MTFVVPIVLFGYIPVVFLLFSMVPPRRAVIVSYVFGWLLLPMAAYSFPGFPEFSKVTATSFATFLAVLIFDSKSLARCKPRWYDLPMCAWVLVPMASSVTNGLGVYDGLSAMLGAVCLWGIPYLLGRAYFYDVASVRELAIGVFVGGLLYIPLCLIEIRLSPQLHRWVYGFTQHQFGQTKRYGGFRPMVFLQHGLAVGLWMAAASVTGFWLWWTGSLKRLFGVPTLWWLGVLVLTTVMVKSFGAIALMFMGMMCLAVTRWTGTRFILMMFAIVPLAYIGARTVGGWQGAELVNLAGSIGGSERAGSLAFRMRFENILVDRALERVIFGWGGWGRNRPIDMGEVVTDGFWVIAFGQRGIVGLAAVLGAMVVGPILVFNRLRGSMWKNPAYAGAVAMGVVLVLYLIDNLFNAMTNPIFALAMGGLPAVAAGLRRAPAHAVRHGQTRGPSPIGAAPRMS